MSNKSSHVCHCAHVIDTLAYKAIFRSLYKFVNVKLNEGLQEMCLVTRAGETKT